MLRENLTPEIRNYTPEHRSALTITQIKGQGDPEEQPQSVQVNNDICIPAICVVDSWLTNHN